MEEFNWFNTTQEIGDTEVIDHNFGLVFWSLIVVNLICIAIVRTSSPTYLRTLFVTGIFNRQLLQNTQEDLRLFGPSAFLLNLVYLNCLAIVASFFIPGGISSYTFLLIGIASATVILKFGVMKLVMYLSKTREGVFEHHLNHLVYFQIAGIILTPLLIFTYYLPEDYSGLIALSLAILVAFFIFIREIQSLARAIRSRIAVLYIILYLCTLEILPLVLIIRLFVNV